MLVSSNLNKRYSKLVPVLPIGSSDHVSIYMDSQNQDKPTSSKKSVKVTRAMRESGICIWLLDSGSQLAWGTECDCTQAKTDAFYALLAVA